jgi:hypothetical protein
MEIKEKILNILFVRRSEIENKWWNRLFTVLLFGSGIFVFVLAVLLIIPTYYDHTWITYHSEAFSLESNYQQAKGKEFPCNGSLDLAGATTYGSIKPIVECKGVEIPLNDARRYGILYDLAEKKLRETSGVEALDDKFNQICKDEVSLQTFPTSNERIFTPAYIAKLECEVLKKKADRSYNQLYNQYQNDLKNLAHIKAASNVHIGSILGDIALLALIPIFSVLIWIFFWSSIIYRSVLYIVFGDKK